MNEMKNLEILSKATFDELYTVDTIIELTRKTCMDCEFNSNYNLPSEIAIRISTERNHYINMLNILSEKINTIMELNQSIENEITSQQNTDYGSRKVTAQCTTY